jgi:hypothetical protein
MDHWYSGRARVGTVLVVWLLIAHVVTGAALIHGPAASQAARDGATSAAAAAIPTEAVAAVCGDGGACSRSDRPSTVTLDLVAQLMPVVALVAVAAALLLLAARRPRWTAPGPAPPPHLSAHVVLVV